MLCCSLHEHGFYQVAEINLLGFNNRLELWNTAQQRLAFYQPETTSVFLVVPWFRDCESVISHYL